jgi:hypothetical protein
MKPTPYQVTGNVEIFQVEKPWIYVRIPERYTEALKDRAERGLVAVTITCGSSTWPSSLLPMGDGTQFIALPAKVRKKEGIEVGDTVSLTFLPRQRL